MNFEKGINNKPLVNAKELEEVMAIYHLVKLMYLFLKKDINLCSSYHLS